MNSHWKRPVVVLGMHRSGTSAVAGYLERLGVCMGRRLSPGDEWNPRGYFEDCDLVKLNERLLSAHGIRWDSLDDGISLDETCRKAHALEVTRWVTTAFGHSPTPWGFKDPRICRLESFWSGWFDDEGLAPRMVLVVRNPRDIAFSLQRRDGIAMTRSIWLWMRHIEGALKLAAKAPNATWVDFARLGRNPKPELLGLAERLEIEYSPIVRTELHDFIDTRFTHAPVEDFPQIAGWAEAAFEMLSEAAAVGMCARDLLASADWQANLASSKGERECISQQFSKIFSGDTQLNQLESQIQALSEALANAKQLVEELGGGIITLNNQLQETEIALSEAAKLAVDRLKELAAMDRKLHETQSALDFAATLAEERLSLVVCLNAELASTTEAFAKAERLAYDRLDEINRLVGKGSA